MKQWIVLIVTLVIIISFNFWQINYLTRTSRYLLTDILDIQNGVEEKDFESIKNGVYGLESTWMSVKDTWDVLGEHDDVEEITEHILSMKIYAESKNEEEVIKEYTLLENHINCVLETEKLKFNNVL